MPRVGPGGDNVTGDRYTMDIGVSPDLGDLLGNLKVANDYLDQAEQRLRSINDVVGSTTQRLAAATRQTQLLAAETQRLQNSYAAIATSTMSMANMGMGGYPGMMGMGMGMGGYGSMPMYQPGGGRPLAESSYSAQTMESGVGDTNATGYYGGESSTTAPIRMPSMRLTQGLQLLQGRSQLLQGQEIMSLEGKSGGKFGRIGRGGISRAIGQFKAGYAGPVTQSAAAPELSIGAETFGGEGGAASLAASALPAAPEAGLLGSLGGAAATAGPYIAAAVVAAKVAEKVYGVWAGAQAESRRIAGMTGGEAGYAGMMGNNLVPGSIGLSARARWMSLLNPGVDYSEIQDRTLSAGYVQGKGYENARDYLFENYKKGLGNTVDQMDLYREAVDKAGDSTGHLNDQIDSLRAVASNSAVSIDTLMSNMKAGVENLTAQGLSGTAATTYATQGAQAYAANTITALNPNLRDAGGYNIVGSPYSQVRAATLMNVPGGIGGMAPFMHSGMSGNNPNVVGEQVARDTLMNVLGFKEGMTADQGGGLDQYITSRGWGAFTSDGRTTIIGDILQNQFHILPANFDAGDYQSLLTWIYATINIQPMKQQADATKAAMAGQSLTSGNATDAEGHPIDTASRVGARLSDAGHSLISGMNVPGWGAAQVLASDQSVGGKVVGVAENLSGVGAALNLARAGRDAIFGVNEATQSASENYAQNVLGLDTSSGVGAALQSQFSQQGAMTSPILEKILAGDADPNNTFIKDASGSISTLGEWISRTPKWQQQLQSGAVTVAHAGEDTMKALNGQTLGIEGTQVATSGALEFSTTEQEMGAVGDLIDGTQGQHGNGAMIIDETSIIRLSSEIATAIKNS